MRNRFLIITVLSLFLIITSWHISSADETDFYLKIQRALTNFEKVYKTTNQHYVEEFDPYEFVKAGIDGMLSHLDPYTVFIEPEGEINLQIITTGKYGGLGMEIGMRNDQIMIISPLDDSPAKRSGIRAGDILKKINGVSVESMSTQKVSNLLRGPVGTDVEITISRSGNSGDITMTMMREEILIEDVNYSDFVADNIAYVRLIGFTDKAGKELKEAIKNLQSESEIKAFILDIRGNSGGLLESAVEVANVFLQKNTPVVTTKGFRDGEHEFKTRTEPLLPDVPLVVLVDGGSASASEIVAGALQDLDRAIIVGTETFGKGLVQKVYSVDGDTNTKLKITTSKYYIPSGRCIQKKDYTKNNIVFTSDSSQMPGANEPSEFYTNNKRQVFEKGGITPDITVEEPDLSNLEFELYKQGIFFNFAVQYKQKHPEWKPEYESSNVVMDEFYKYLDDINFEYKIEGETNLSNFIEVTKNNKISNGLASSVEKLIEQLQEYKEKDIISQRDKLYQELLPELADKYFNDQTKIEYTLKNDYQLHSAVGVLKNRTEYKKILAIK